MGAGGATTAVAGDTEVATQILQRPGAALRGFADLGVGHCLADTNVHALPPDAYVNANNSYSMLLRMIVNNDFCVPIALRFCAISDSRP
jgi:hypothetical protein